LTPSTKSRQEGFQRSQVMDITSWLTDVYGPRLTNSPGFRKAGEWAVKEMTVVGPVERQARAVGRPDRSVRSRMVERPVPHAGDDAGRDVPVYGMSTAWTPGTAVT
jgi:carboxypeptidase Q